MKLIAYMNKKLKHKSHQPFWYIFYTFENYMLGIKKHNQLHGSFAWPTAYKNEKKSDDCNSGVV